MLKQLRTNIFVEKDQLPKMSEDIKDYIEDCEIDIENVDDLDLDRLLGIFHWAPVYDKNGNLCKLNYTGDEQQYGNYDDFDILDDFDVLISLGGGFVDVLVDGNVVRHLYDDGHEVFSPLYNYSYRKDCDEETAALRDFIITEVSSEDICLLGNRFYSETNQAEKIFYPIKEFNDMINSKNLSPLEIIRDYGRYHEFMRNAAWYKDRFFNRPYTYYEFFTDVAAADEVLLNVTEIASYCIKKHTSLGCKKIIEFLEKEK